MRKGPAVSLGYDTDLLNLVEPPVFVSSFKLGGSEVTQIGGTAVDSQGNIYVTGGFTGSITFDTQPAPTILTSTNGYDFFLAKFDPDGNSLWARAAHGDLAPAENFSLDGGIAIAVDRSGNCYVGGGFVRSLAFQDAGNNVIATLIGSDGNTLNFEMFVAKYATDGQLLWARGGGSQSIGNAADLASGTNVVGSIILDIEDLPYIGGRYSGTNFLGTTVSPVGGTDFFIAALSADQGDPEWIQLLGTPGDDGVVSLALDTFGFINALGYLGTGEIMLPSCEDPTTAA